MRLAEFIRTNKEQILIEWEEFARTCTPAAGAMDIEALRDHASEMLIVFADDLETPQGDAEQAEKGKGNAPVEAAATAAVSHGAERAESGFSVEQMISEYRALRASVIRLWTKNEVALETANLEDLTRFNEAIDQALAESVTRYTQELDQSKEMFLAILGHDLRSPLGAVMMSAEFMLETKDLTEPHLSLTTRISSSAKRMNSLVGDLLDFTRSRLGGGIPIERAPMDMAKAVNDVTEELAAGHPGRKIEVTTRGRLNGEWDCPRISQALSNLIGNALEYGAEGSVVNVNVAGEAESVTVEIHNLGVTIPAEQLNGIFNPMKRKEANAIAAGPSANLGLGLYIADRIVNAHDGTIDVESSDADGTMVRVSLPRR